MFSIYSLLSGRNQTLLWLKCPQIHSGLANDKNCVHMLVSTLHCAFTHFSSMWKVSVNSNILGIDLVLINKSHESREDRWITLQSSGFSQLFSFIFNLHVLYLKSISILLYTLWHWLYRPLFAFTFLYLLVFDITTLYSCTFIVYVLIGIAWLYCSRSLCTS